MEENTNMPIITFTDADIMATTVVPPEWYPAVIKKIDGPTESASKKSINFFMDIAVNGHAKYSGKEVRVAFSSGSNAPSVLGNIMWYPTAWLRPLIAAVLGIPLEEVPKSSDLDQILNRPFDIKFDIATSADGGTMNVISAWLPEGKGVNQKPPF